MSAARMVWANLLLRVAGAAFIIIGGVIVSTTLTNAERLGGSTGLFVILGVIVMVAGIFPLLAKST